MTIRLTGLFGIGLALCCCCPQRYAQVNSSITQSEGESSKNEGQVRVIEGWNIAVVGEWGNGRVVEWPLMEPIPSPREKVDSDWGFMVIGTKLGPKVVAHSVSGLLLLLLEMPKRRARNWTWTISLPRLIPDGRSRLREFLDYNQHHLEVVPKLNSK